MLGYGKMAQQAVAAVSYLAERFGEGVPPVAAAEIAESRELPRPLVAKIMTMLAQSGHVIGAPGPGGGYRLAREPEALSLYDIVSSFERIDEIVMCPFGPNWCGNQEPCPLHDAIVESHDRSMAELKDMHFGIFREAKED